MSYPTEHVKNIVSNLPYNPGIYMMRDENGKIIYVGKAISLRKRVRQYFQKNNKTPRIEKMVTLIRDISYIVTNNEVEALALECNYIKENNPTEEELGKWIKLSGLEIKKFFNTSGVLM